MTRPSLPAAIFLPLAAITAVTIVGCPEGSSTGNAGNVATSNVALTDAEVEQVLLDGIAELRALNLPGAIAVTDREGEVLGVFVTGPIDVNSDGTDETPGEGNVQAAISKAATAAAFQSEGEAFTTRTAFFIVQGHYPPGVRDTAGGPLFGVQDSSQRSSDVRSLAWDQDGDMVGAGLSGLLGGIPLFKQGSPVGGVGVDIVGTVVTQGGEPTLVTPLQRDDNEQVARSAARRFECPHQIQATHVFVDGIGFPFYGQNTTPANPAPAGSLAALPASAGAIDARFPVRASPLAAEERVSGEYGVRDTYRHVGRVASRFEPSFTGTLTNVDRDPLVTFDTATLAFASIPISPLSTRASSGGIGEERAPAIDSIEPPPGAEGGLTDNEVDAIIDRAVGDARASVAGIRLPRGRNVVVHVAVVDARGNLLGMFRMADGTLFSADVAVQKARTAAFFSGDGTDGAPAVAISARAFGFLAQPFFPPGIDNTSPGPLVRLRDLVNRGKVTIDVPPVNSVINPPPRPPSDGTTDENVLVGGRQAFDDYPGAAPAVDLAAARAIIALTGGIATLADRTDTTPNFVSPGLQSGLQTFPGGVPLYRNGRLIGAVGVSGDGVDEDDAAAFAGARGFEPPGGVRCDEVPDVAIASLLSARVDRLRDAIAAHPDPMIANVYTPLFDAVVAEVNARFASGLNGVRIPFVKLPRNPQNP
jgi:uncharacterized protein GlcG (DUF336 family)